MLTGRIRHIVAAATALSLIACSSSPPKPATAPVAHPTASSVSTPTTTAPPATTTTITTTTTTTTAAATTTTTATTTTAAPPAFTGTVSTVTAAALGSSYRAGCPVGPASLRLLRLSHWGFDNRAHVGTLVVSAAVAQEIVAVFAHLFRTHFPVRRMVTIDNYGGDDRASMAADNTSGFNCRYVAGSNPPRWSAHAYGEAIDINTVENPYVSGSFVSPSGGSAYLDRGNLRPGMAAPGTAVNNAFATAGWYWGGRWASPDYQHFSKHGG